MKKKLYGITLIVLGVLGGFGWFLSPIWFPGYSPSQTAQILIKDKKFGMRALGMGEFWGDRILEPLTTCSSDFASLDNRNSFWVAEILANNSSDRSAALAFELYQRAGVFQQLVGAIGLAAHGKLPATEFMPDGKLHSILTNKMVLFNTIDDTTPVELALVAAKYAKSKDSVGAITALVKARPLSYWVHAHSAMALAAIGDPSAIPVLQDAMRAPDFYALPDAFDALVALGDRQAIPLAIDRISPEIENHNSGFLIAELEKVTGKSFGFDQAAWKRWWAAQK